MKGESGTTAYPVLMQQSKGLTGVFWVFLIVFRDERAPDKPAVRVQWGVLRPPDVYYHFVSER